MLHYAIQQVQERGLAGRIDWQKVLEAVAEESGAPLEITGVLRPLRPPPKSGPRLSEAGLKPGLAPPLNNQSLCRSLIMPGPP